jgi:hypothetical protein
MAVCHYHNDRPGVGICMRCRVVICTACCTRVDGVNHCHACLKVLGQRAEHVSAIDFSASLAACFFISVAWLFFFVISWAAQGRLAP